MKVVVAHAADESVEPPKGRRPAPKTDVQEVAHVLRGAGHEVSGIAIDGTPECLRALTQQKPDLVFNLVESFGDDNSKEPHVAAYYDLLGLRYTGSGPRGLTLAMDKAVAKKILAFHNVVSPKFAVFWRGRLDFDAHDVEFPVIVKPLREDGSIGIGFDALAGNIKELMERIDALTAEFNSPILIEQYIEGREIYMGVLGNAPPEALPAVELDLSHLPKGTPRIAGTEVKWNEGSRAYRGSKIRLPKLPKPVLETMQRYALAAFQALGLRDYARIDFRLAQDTVYLIEANPNPYLHSGHEFIRGARASGRTHPATILEILELARLRYAALLPR
ncbi:MAG TPA: D-alanine--D-alanine ligase [Methylomirabilota bacterium]|nr:D-alanine--D-alanine ligase [Methylomirabilota bacterium]